MKNPPQTSAFGNSDGFTPTAPAVPTANGLILSHLVEACRVTASKPTPDRRFWLMSTLLNSLMLDDVDVALQALAEVAEEALPPETERMFTRSENGDVIAINHRLAYEDEDVMRLCSRVALVSDVARRQALVECAALALIQDADADLGPLLEQAA